MAHGAALTLRVEHIFAVILEPTDIAVTDNRFMRKNVEVLAVRTAIEATGAATWDFAPYTTDLNPIEKTWSKAKAHPCKSKAHDAEALCQLIGDAMV